MTKATPAELDFIEAASAGDLDDAHNALVEIQRDPTRWFCSGSDENGMPRVFGRGGRLPVATGARAAFIAAEGGMHARHGAHVARPVAGG